MRDIRQWIGAISLARRGLYIFGRASLYSGCMETRPLLEKMLERPVMLNLETEEKYGKRVEKRTGSHQTTTIMDVAEMGNLIFQRTTKEMATISDEDTSEQEADLQSATST